jgi:hypothetical protein
MNIQTVCSGDADRCLIVGDGRGGTQLGCGENAGFS